MIPDHQPQPSVARVLRDILGIVAIALGVLLTLGGAYALDVRYGILVTGLGLVVGGIALGSESESDSQGKG